MLDLKYKDQLENANTQPCPCTTKFEERDITAYRFMNRTATQSDFMPVAASGSADTNRCDNWSLSFFNTLDSARRKFKKLNERIDAKSRFGDHIGELDLIPDDGVSNQSNPKTGHFDLHEKAGVSFTERVNEYHLAIEEEAGQ